MAILAKLAILPILFALVAADFPFDVYEEVAVESRNDEISMYRLPESIDTPRIEFTITPYFEAEGDKEAFTFDGEADITVVALESVSVITFQDNLVDILNVTVTSLTGEEIPLNTLLPFERLTDYQLLKIYLADGQSLSVGQTYNIKVFYLGRMNETPITRGMFRGSYIGSDGIKHWYAATHLQPTHARQIVPCLDEPGFKSVFKITVNRPSHFTDTFSNMQIAERTTVGNRTKEVFYDTPKMSAYLITIHISEEFTVIAENNDSSRPYRIIARPNAQGQGAYALEVGPPLTTWLDEYLGVPYYSMGEDMKNDQLASPDWASGATENWGLVSYREIRLLYEEGETSSLDKMTIGTITAHELAHKWFGNLVTARWWDNVWINEGYASYFEYFAMDAVDPSLGLADMFIVDYMQSALSADSSASTRALQHTVNSPTEVTGHFSGISYSKGAALLLMLRRFIGEESFRKGMNYYLVERSYDHAFPEDVFKGYATAAEEDQSLTAFPNVNLTQFLNIWVNEPGYPVIDVEVDPTTGVMSLSQERFFISSATPQTDQIWPIPLTFTTESNPNFENLTPTHVMTEKTYEITKDAQDEWVIFNLQQNGIYRVNYDTHTWELIAAALKNNKESIHYLNRAQIVDDVFALMRAERLPYELGFKILEFLKDETDFYVWFPAITGFTWYRNRFLHLPSILAQYDELLFEYMNKVINHVGYDSSISDSLSTIRLRFSLMSSLCSIGHPGCTADAVSKFNRLYVNGDSVDPNLRRHVYCSALNNGGYDEWKFLYNMMINSNNQAAEVALLRALGCTSNEDAIQEYLETILSDNVRAQDRVNGFTFLFMGVRGNAERALSFVQNNVDAIRNSVITSGNFASILSNMASYMQEDGLNEMESWLQANQAAIPEASTGLSAISSVRTNIQWGTQNADEIIKAVKGTAHGLVPTLSVLILGVMAMRIFA